VELVTERLVLREFEEADFTSTNIYERDPEVVRYQSHGVRSPAESRDYIRAVIEESRKSPRHLFDLAVTLREDGRLIGRCGMRMTAPEIREAALWYVLHPAFWRRGYITEAARALVGFGFEDLDVHRFFIDCDPQNIGSARVAQKLGMRREAHFVENAWLKGEWRDSLIYAILEREWRASTKARPDAP
jgi:[ribosomal protein S5]-alanine N-acetyltransferase